MAGGKPQHMIKLFVRRIQNRHPAATCDGALCTPKGNVSELACNRDFPNCKYVHCSQTHQEYLRHWGKRCHFILQGTSSCSSGETPIREVCRACKGDTVIISFPPHCKARMIPLLHCWMSHWLSSILGSDPVSSSLQRDRPTFSAQYNRPKLCFT